MTKQFATEDIGGVEMADYTQKPDTKPNQSIENKCEIDAKIDALVKALDDVIGDSVRATSILPEGTEGLSMINRIKERCIKALAAHNSRNGGA